MSLSRLSGNQPAQSAVNFYDYTASQYSGKANPMFRFGNLFGGEIALDSQRISINRVNESSNSAYLPTNDEIIEYIQSRITDLKFNSNDLGGTSAYKVEALVEGLLVKVERNIAASFRLPSENEIKQFVKDRVSANIALSVISETSPSNLGSRSDTAPNPQAIVPMPDIVEAEPELPTNPSAPPTDSRPAVTNNVIVDPTITVAPNVYDAALSNNQGVILKILFNALVSGSLAYVLSEDSIYYAALGGIISAIKRQVTPDVTFAENDNASDANINNWNLFYEGATIGGGVGVSYYLKNSNPIKSAIINIGVSRYSSKLLP